MPDERTDVRGVAASRERLIRLVRLLWGSIGALVLLTYAQGPVEAVVTITGTTGILSSAGVFAIIRAVLVLAVIGILIWIGVELIPALVGTTRRVESLVAEAPTSSPGQWGFPQYPTVVVGAWLLVLAVAFTVGLFVEIAPAATFGNVLPTLRCTSDDAACKEVKNLVVTMLAGGIGSTIATISGYLQHASEEKDFDLAYAPWYVGRPLTGVLLAVVFYFLLQGGLLATVGTIEPSKFNSYGLAGIAALVGLFSKNAIAKLRDVFSTLFVAEADVSASLIKKLPQDLQEAVRDALKRQ